MSPKTWHRAWSAWSARETKISHGAKMKLWRVSFVKYSGLPILKIDSEKACEHQMCGWCFIALVGFVDMSWVALLGEVW